MSSDYFDSSDHQQVAATRARASAINNALDALDTGLALLPTEANIKRGLINYGVDSGAADAYVVTLPYTATALTDGMQVVFKASAANTGACTINVDSLGVKSIKRHDGTDPVAGDIGASKITELRYNSTTTVFEIQGNVGMAAGAGTLSAQNANDVAITGGTVIGVNPYVGYLVRSKFTYVDANTITVGPGQYDVSGTLAKITSTLTTTAHGGTGADIMYLYIDYSSIPGDGVLLQSDLIWSTTAPTWSDSLLGWYNGDDRCIFAVVVAVTTDAITEFAHVGNYVSCAVAWDSGTVGIAWADLATPLFIPAFSRLAKCTFTVNYDAAPAYVSWRTKGMTNTNYAGYVAVGSDWCFNTTEVYTDSSQELQCIASAALTASVVAIVGWYLPEGI